MTNAITELWYGNIDPAQAYVMNDPEIRQLERQMNKNEERLERELGENGKELLEKYISCMFDYVSANCRQAFCCGYSVGSKLTAEAMIGAEKIIANS